MAIKHRTLQMRASAVGSTMRGLSLAASDYSVHYYWRNELMAIVDIFNNIPVIVDESGTKSFVTGASEPTWTTGYISYTDADSDDMTLVVDDSAVDMVTVGTFDVTWTVTDEYGDSASLTIEITITAS